MLHFCIFENNLSFVSPPLDSHLKNFFSQNANFFFFTFETNEIVISFQNANYVYFHTQFKINLIFRIQTIFTFKFNSKVSFMYIYQHDNDGPPYSTLVIDQISFWLYLRFKRNKHKCNFHYVAMPMMTSHILKSHKNTKI